MKESSLRSLETYIPVSAVFRSVLLLYYWGSSTEPSSEPPYRHRRRAFAKRTDLPASFAATVCGEHESRLLYLQAAYRSDLLTSLDHRKAEDAPLDTSTSFTPHAPSRTRSVFAWSSSEVTSTMGARGERLRNEGEMGKTACNSGRLDGCCDFLWQMSCLLYNTVDLWTCSLQVIRYSIQFVKIRDHHTYPTTLWHSLRREPV